MYLIKSRWKVRGPNEGIQLWCLHRGNEWVAQTPARPGSSQGTEPFAVRALPLSCPGLSLESCLTVGCSVAVCSSRIWLYVLIYRLWTGVVLAQLDASFSDLLETRKEMLHIKHMKNPGWTFSLCWPVASLFYVFLEWQNHSHYRSLAYGVVRQTLKSFCAWQSFYFSSYTSWSNKWHYFLESIHFLGIPPPHQHGEEGDTGTQLQSVSLRWLLL